MAQHAQQAVEMRSKIIGNSFGFGWLHRSTRTPYQLDDASDLSASAIPWLAARLVPSRKLGLMEQLFPALGP
jgi:hypothetical protein